MAKIRILLVLLVVMLAACASGPEYDTSKVDPSLIPKSVVAEIDQARDRTVLWGGMILSVKNLEDMTHLEILAFPLDDNQKPRTDNDPLGRFLIYHPGYLEGATYAQGRIITTLGTVNKLRAGKVGESEYTYPVIVSNQVYLWPRGSSETETRFHFGIGVMF